MADNHQERGGRDRERINLSESWERTYWRKALGGITDSELENPVKAVGDRAEKVREYLGGGSVRH